MEEKTVPVSAPLIGFSLQVQLTPQKTLVIQSHVDADVSDSVLNSALDKIVRAADRIDDHYTLPILERGLEAMERELAAAVKNAQDDVKALAGADVKANVRKKLWVGSDKRGEFVDADRFAKEREALQRQSDASNVAVRELTARLAASRAAYEQKRKTVNGDAGATDRSASASDS